MNKFLQFVSFKPLCNFSKSVIAYYITNFAVNLVSFIKLFDCKIRICKFFVLKLDVAYIKSTFAVIASLTI